MSVLKYDLLTDLAPVAMLVSYPLGMAVSTKTGVNNAKEYVAWVKANPKEALFGSAGLGGHTHFTGLQLGKVAGVPTDRSCPTRATARSSPIWSVARCRPAS